MKQVKKVGTQGQPPFLLRKIAAATALSVGLVASAGAANINDFINSGPNQASDEDREFLIDRVGGVVGQVDVGDSLLGLINFNTVNSGSANLGGATGNDEFSGVFSVRVAAIGAPDLLGISSVTLEPDPLFGATLAALGVVGTPAFLGGEVAVLFTDPSINFCADFGDGGACGGITGGLDDGTVGASGLGVTPPNPTDVSGAFPVDYDTEAAFINTATDGAFWASLGWVGADGLPGTGDEAVAGVGEGIFGSAPQNILTAFGLTSGSSAGNINAGLNLIATGAGLIPAFLSTV